MEYLPETPGAEAVIVERLQAETLTSASSLGLLALRQAAYSERLNVSAPPESISQEEIARHLASLKHAGMHGHRFWVIPNPQAQHEHDMFDGFIWLYKEDGGDTRLRQIHVRPPFRRGNGSKLLHAALTADDWPRNERLTLYATPNNPAKEMFIKLGIQETLIKGPDFVFMATRQRFALQGVIDAIETRHSKFSQAQRISAT